MKRLNTYITEYIIKKKLDKPIDSEYKYHPQTREELINNINECIDLGEYNLNVIDVSSIKDMSKLFRSVNLNKIKTESYSNIVINNNYINSNKIFSIDMPIDLNLAYVEYANQS